MQCHVAKWGSCVRFFWILQEEQRELANTIRVSGSILLSTVSNFLDFFKLEAVSFGLDCLVVGHVSCVLCVYHVYIATHVQDQCLHVYSASLAACWLVGDCGC